MAAGYPYFAWIDPTETTFGSEHLRWDEDVFSFKLSQEEGDHAALTLKVRRPRDGSGNPLGLLSPGRKQWCWFALDCGPSLLKFRGRLVGVPTDVFQELITLDFVAKPIDIVAQKMALAQSLAVLPYYDPALIAPERRIQAGTTGGGDPDTVLDGYTAIWHYDRETHVITISDEIQGEDGTVSFDMSDAAHKVLYDGLGFAFPNNPLARVELTAEFNWTQQAAGVVDLTQYLLANWPRPSGTIHATATPFGIPLDESQWPKPGAGLGGGWAVADSTAKNLFNYDVRTETNSSQVTTIFPDGDTVRGTSSSSIGKISGPGVTIGIRTVTTNDLATWQTQPNPDGGTFTAQYTRNTTQVEVELGIQEIQPTLVAGFAANSPMTEKVKITLVADVQPLLTDPADGEALIIDDVRSVNLSEPIDGVIPMGDAARPSYIATERGNQSIQYLINLMRAHLMKRARAVEITFAPKLERMPEITLRKSAFLEEPRVGQATGKIIAYSVELDGADGRVKCEVKIGCTIGNGGTTVEVAGTPNYVSADYVGADYQQFTGRMIAIDTSVSYSPPNAIAGGLNFLGSISAADVIVNPLVVQWGDAPDPSTLPPEAISGHDALEVVTEFVKAYWLPQFETQATFKLIDVQGGLTNEYEIATSSLKIPTGIDLAAVG